MYVRDARNRDEVWLLDHIEELGLDDASFRSRDYVIAVDEETNAKAGFGRIRIHKGAETDYCELTSVGVLSEWRDQGVGAHVVERLVENASDEGFDELYAFVEAPEYLEPFGFEPVSEDDLPDQLRDRLATKRDGLETDITAVRLDIGAFRMPDRLRDAFKVAGEREPDDEPEETAEDFGIDPDSATYKYDTG